MPPPSAIPDGYVLAEGVPPVEDYLRLRRLSGLTPRRHDQARAVAAGTWYGVFVEDVTTKSIVGMGRLIGDGAWCFHVVDMAVLPDHQRRGLGDVILRELLERIRDRAPAGALVSLLGDPPGVRLYRRHGFTETAPGSLGMARYLEDAPPNPR